MSAVITNLVDPDSLGAFAVSMDDAIENPRLPPSDHPPGTIDETEPGIPTVKLLGVTAPHPSGDGYVNVPADFPGQLTFDPEKPQTFTDEHYDRAKMRAWKLIRSGVQYPIYQRIEDAVLAAQRLTSPPVAQTAPAASPTLPTLRQAIGMGTPADSLMAGPAGPPRPAPPLAPAPTGEGGMPGAPSSLVGPEPGTLAPVSRALTPDEQTRLSSEQAAGLGRLPSVGTAPGARRPAPRRRVPVKSLAMP